MVEERVLAQIRAALQAPERIQGVWDAVRTRGIGFTEPEVVPPMLHDFAAVWRALYPVEQQRIARLLTLLSPTLVKGLLAGRQPRTLSLIWLKNHEVPASWDDQAALFGRMDR